jgi:hypothetical protein
LGIAHDVGCQIKLYLYTVISERIISQGTFSVLADLMVWRWSALRRGSAMMSADIDGRRPFLTGARGAEVSGYE